MLELEGGGAVLGLEVEVELDGEDTEALKGLCACAREPSCEREANDRGKAKRAIISELLDAFIRRTAIFMEK